MLYHAWTKTVAISATVLITLILLFRSSIGLLPGRFTGSTHTPEPTTNEPTANDDSQPTIPNIVHYVYVMKEPSGDLHFELKDFISIYSASLYLKPDAIYIHTDATNEAVARAKESGEAANKWTRLILNMPGVRIGRVTAPEYASNGVKIKYVQNKSDFVRAKVVHEYGGIYLDWDVHALRDFKPLREAGFANVVGLQKHGAVGTGCILAVKGSELMRLWLKNEHIVYDGEWITHAVILLNKMARRLAAIPREVLILDESAFAPGSWELEDMEYLFGSHFKVQPSGLTNLTEGGYHPGDEEALWDSAENFEPWEADYSSTYALHAFRGTDNSILIKNFDEITMEYILARQSNFARAVYPAVRHAINAGIVSLDEG
jgi:Glycosyltransferase sugar-binding region containing DXD motif